MLAVSGVSGFFHDERFGVCQCCGVSVGHPLSWLDDVLVCGCTVASQSPVGGHSDSFHFLAFVSRAVDTPGHVCVRTFVFHALASRYFWCKLSGTRFPPPSPRTVSRPVNLKVLNR